MSPPVGRPPLVGVEAEGFSDGQEGPAELTLLDGVQRTPDGRAAGARLVSSLAERPIEGLGVDEGQVGDGDGLVSPECGEQGEHSRVQLSRGGQRARRIGNIG